MFEFNKKFEYDDQIDPEVIPLCDILNALPGIKTTSSCCGHNHAPFTISFQVNNTNIGLFFLIRSIDRKYWEYGYLWKVELSVVDSWKKEIPLHYNLNSGNIVGKLAYNQSKQLIKNLNDNLNNEKFINQYNIDLNEFNLT
jgi:hypothetical protein